VLCVSVSSSGVPTVDGTAVSACPTGTYVLLTQVEFDQYAVSPWKLSPDEAGPIVGAILLLWAFAYGLRMAIRAVGDTAVTINEGGE